MTSPSFTVKALLCAVLAAMLWPPVAAAQTSQAVPVPSRITEAINEANVVTLHGNTHPLAQARLDQGAAADSMPMQRMLLVLKRSANQEAALDSLLDQQQDPTSASYHHWLTPQQFGQQFGPSDQDIQTVTNWLQSHGFTVSRVSNGRTVIEFSGTAGQILRAFHTEIHRYAVNGQSHWANASDPQIPGALSPVVAGVNTLYNFPRRAMHQIVGTFTRSPVTGQIQRVGSQYTIDLQNNVLLAVGPADFAKIYNVPNLALSPEPSVQYNGDSETIAIVGDSDIDPQDINAFRTLFGLPTPAKLTTIASGVDPGMDPGGSETEADLDIEWAGAVAPNAAIDLVVAQSTESSLGVDLAAQYVVDNNLAPVLNESFGICEFFMGNADNLFYSQLWQQAAAEGITVTVSSGDGGSAVCDQNAGTSGAAQYGLSVSGFTSTPYNVSVGGTDFNDIGIFQQFWNTTPKDSPSVASVVGYVPEMSWNDTCSNQEVFGSFGVTSTEQSCNNATEKNDGLVSIGGGSGGMSNCIQSNGVSESTCSQGYAKPSWQTGPGVPDDGVRDVPDVSLFASDGFNASFYPICESDLNPGATSCDPFSASSTFLGVGGTSASSPAFAGIVALVNQATGQRQGNLDYVLYKLASQSGNTCTSAANPASTCVFYDVPSGSTIAMPCVKGSPDVPGQTNSPCSVELANDTVGILSGYDTGTGYDLATGLGSVNAANLISKWKTFETNLTPSSTALTLTAATSLANLTHGESVEAVVNVTGSGGTPSGTVSLIAQTNTNAQQSVANAPLINGSASFSANSLPGGTNYSVFAQYSGDGTFQSSMSASTPVTVAAEQSKLTIAYELFDPTTGALTNSNATTASFGAPSLLRMNVTSQSTDACAQNTIGSRGCPTGTLAVTDNGNALDGGLFGLNAQGYAEDQVISLPPGTHQLSASYPGDGSFTAATASDALTINKASTTITLSSDTGTTWKNGGDIAATVATGSYATAKADLPTGTMEFLLDGNTVISSSLPVQGGVNSQTGAAQATSGVELPPVNVPVGHHTITAQYSGDANYATSVSAPFSFTETYTTTTNLSFSLPSPGSSSMNVVAQINPIVPNSLPAPTGTVQFNVGSASGTSLGSGSVSSGVAQITVSASSLPSGAVVFATYSGDTNYQSSSGSATVGITLLATTTTVSLSPSAPVAGAPIVFTASVTSPATGGPALTGSVLFNATSPYGFYTYDTKPLVNGQAQDTISLWAGLDPINIVYSGDSNYASSTTTLTENVSPIATATTLTSSNSASHVGDNLAFTASVSAAQSGPTPNGSFQFYEDGAVIGTANPSNGQAVFSTSSLAAGIHSLTATYGGDAYHSASSATLAQTVSPGATTTALSASNSSILSGAFVTLTAQVNATSSAAPSPTGSIQFSFNGTSLAIVRLSAQKAQFSTGSLAVGADQILASYSGDSNYTASSSTLTETVSAATNASFTISASPAALTIPSPGLSASTTLTFTSTGGLAGVGGLSSSTCGIAAAEEISCTLSTFTLAANGTAQAALTFNSVAASMLAQRVPSYPSLGSEQRLRILLLLMIPALAAVIFLEWHNNRRWQLIFGAILLAVLVGSASCGGGGGNNTSGGLGGSGGAGGTGGSRNAGTPTGAVQLSVSISIAGVTQTVPNLTLNVQ